MRIISRNTLKLFWIKHEDAEQPLKSWFQQVRSVKWHSPQDIKNTFNSVDFLACNRAIFNIKGNKYRLIVAIRYDKQIIFIRFIGTHAEYNKINAVNI